VSASLSLREVGKSGDVIRPVIPPSDARHPRLTAPCPAHITPQMEALCYDADSQTLWFTIERPTPLYRLKP
jgi:hypothetical protein